MVGGKGWENNDFLDSLGGGDEDREQAQQNYEQFKETRESFNQRQAERMKSPQAQAFLKQQQSRAQQESFFDDDDSLEDESYGDLGVSSGGSRFRNLMQKSQQMKRGMGGGGASFVDPSTGLEQKFVVPLEPDEGASDNNTDGELE
ncbi:expressed unknown protein [Seminavis robusta]|uniref:Uncharacterized protein n=1 Tax=Seminavis robusta TaxID=568900 RepID=A0A9N8HMP0_9STRA|nr:expressed unknown protein [Seminavis robusta]|eukprot:Sro761_g198470.1 n/a (146) ;mRNA; r:4281-4792